MIIHLHRNAHRSQRILKPVSRPADTGVFPGGSSAYPPLLTQEDHDAIPLGLFAKIKERLGENRARWLRDLYDAHPQVDNRSVIRDFTVPLVAVSNNDGRRTYIDRRVPDYIFVVKRRGNIAAMSPDLPLNEHEEVEWTCMHHGGLDYLRAHEIALIAERLIVEHLGFIWSSYDAVMQDLIRFCAEAPDDNPAPDPYLTLHQVKEIEHAT